VKRWAAAAVAVVVATSIGLAACGGDDDGGGSGSATKGGVTVSEAWARTTPPGVTVGAVYFTAKSDGDDALLGATVDAEVAASTQLHTESTSGDMTSMAPVSSMPVTASAPLALDPLGSHLMLVDLTGPLTQGEHFDVTLHFRTAGDLTVPVEVRDDAP
jgi:periplasmic copper chaperone A